MSLLADILHSSQRFIGNLLAYICLFVLLKSDLTEERWISDEMIQMVPPPTLAGTCSSCLTPGCVRAANRLLDNIDFSVNPCEDFYQYACGGFIENHEIPDDKSFVTTLGLHEEYVKMKLKKLIPGPKWASEPKAFWKIREFYFACMNFTRIEERGAKPLVDLLERLGGWPAVKGDKWDESSFEWINALYQLKNEGFGGNLFIFDLYIPIDVKNTSRLVIELDEPTFGIKNRAYLLEGLNNTLVRAYLALMVDVAKALGANSETVEEEMNQVLQMEITLANWTLPIEERLNHTKLYNLMTVANLSTLTPQFKWQEFLNTFLPQEITENEPIVVKVPSYFKKAFEYFINTPKRVMANYLTWRAAKTTLNLLGKQFRDILVKYDMESTGQSQETKHWVRCVDTTTYFMPLAVGAIYARKHFEQEHLPEVAEMVKEIRKQFHSTLITSDWMDNSTQEKALLKLKAMKEYIGFPSEFLDDKKIDDFYSQLEVRADEHFENVMRARKFRKNYYLSLLRKPVNETEWVEFGNEAIDANAYYYLPSNSMHFNMGILRGVYFDHDRPKYMNYGSIGLVIGHEITHGFDHEGRQYDSEGNSVNWWEEETENEFLQKAQCFIDQYSNFTDPESKVQGNGILTQGENIADNGGVNNAYQAYNNWVKKNGPEFRLPGLNFTQKQLFWLSAATGLCGNERSKYLEENKDISPSRFRVTGMVINSLDFGKDFSCPVGSPMNPVEKCVLW
uniref:Neprilysin n=1 Tax=Hemiscolopendra marginata TaxID=943146 RepID=A0A646QC39_9MYRI